MTLVRRIALLVVLMFLACAASFAQVTTGTPPFGSVDAASGPDVIDLANLNAHIAIPVLHKAGRGLNFTYDLSNDSSVWYPVASGSTTSWQPVYNWGWRAETEAVTGYVSYTEGSANIGRGCSLHIFSNFVYHDAWGVPHPFPGAEGDGYSDGQNTCSNCDDPPYFCFYGFTAPATDGSGYTLYEADVSGDNSPPDPVIYDRDGKTFNVPLLFGYGQANSTDRNGNFISVDGSGNFYDTLSGTTPAFTVAAPSPPTSTTFTYEAPSGANASYTVKYGTYTVQTNFGCSGINDMGATQEYLVSEIDLPDRTKYTFTYEPTYQHSGSITGRLASVTLPTGGSITYSYGSGGTNGIECADGSAKTLTRTLSDGASWSAQWAYTRLISGTASETTVTAPDSTQAIMQFQGIYQTQRDTYQGSGPTISSLPISESTQQTSSLLQEVQTCYNGATMLCTSTAVSLPISSQSILTILPGSKNLQSKVATTYNSYGQLTEEDDYDFGQGAPPSTPIRKKIITIQTVGTYQAIQTAQIQDGSGHVLTQTQMTFDQGSVTATTGTPQHQNPPVGRGNPTTISYLVGGSRCFPPCGNKSLKALWPSEKTVSTNRENERARGSNTA